MWLRRRKRSAQLPRQLALGLLEDALGRVDQDQRPQHQRHYEEFEAGQAAGAVPEAAAISIPAPRASGPAARHVLPFSRPQAEEPGQNSVPRRP